METSFGFELVSPRGRAWALCRRNTPPPSSPFPGDTRTSADLPSDGGDRLPRVTAPAVELDSMFTSQFQNSSWHPNSNSRGKHPRGGLEPLAQGWEQGWARRVQLSQFHVNQFRIGSRGGPRAPSRRAAPTLLPAGVPKVPPAARTLPQGFLCICQPAGEAPAARRALPSWSCLGARGG